MSYFSTNLKYLREKLNLSQSKLGEMAKVNQTTIMRWENNEVSPSLDNLFDLANCLNISIAELTGKDLKFDNGEVIDVSSNLIKIPVYGKIKAGIPIEQQSDIIEYIDIPKEMIIGNKKYFGLKISGDSMLPKYSEGDTVIFEQNEDVEAYKNKDVAVMINGTESTFKKILINDQGIVLQPYNMAYDIIMFSKEQVENLPVKVLGIAREKRTKID